MDIKVNDELLFSLTETQKKVISNDVREETLDEDLKRRLQYILINKYEKCFERLKAEWMPKLKDRLDSIPTNDDALCNLIFSQPDYESRSVREDKELAKREKQRLEAINE